jgi:hypothetical protein
MQQVRYLHRHRPRCCVWLCGATLPSPITNQAATLTSGLSFQQSIGWHSHAANQRPPFARNLLMERQRTATIWECLAEVRLLHTLVLLGPLAHPGFLSLQQHCEDSSCSCMVATTILRLDQGQHTRSMAFLRGTRESQS